MTLQNAISTGYRTLSSQLGTKRSEQQSPAPTMGLNKSLKDSFQKNFTEFLTSGVNMEFEDPALIARAQELEVKRVSLAEQLRAAQAAADEPNAPAATVRPKPGQQSAMGGGALGAPSVSNLERVASLMKEKRETEHEQLEVLKQAAEVRLAKVSQSLSSRMTAGASMASLRSGNIDLATAHPKSEAEAKAFGERLVIDMAEGAAELDLVNAQLEIAVVEDKTRSTEQTRTNVRTLADRAAATKQQLVQLIKVYERQAGGDAEALRSGSVDRAGFEDEIVALQGAVMEEADTGNSKTLNSLKDQIFEILMKSQQEIIRIERENEQRRAEMNNEIDKMLARRAEQRALAEKAAARARELRGF